MRTNSAGRKGATIVYPDPDKIIVKRITTNVLFKKDSYFSESRSMSLSITFFWFEVWI